MGNCRKHMTKTSISLREKFPNTKFFLVRIYLYSVRIQENTDQKKPRIWTLFMQCIFGGMYMNMNILLLLLSVR